jgi:small GTP-binding protein
MSNTFFKFVFRVAFVGPQSSGKSQLLNRLAKNDFLPTLPPTSGVAHTIRMLPTTKEMADGQIHYWDFSGDPTFEGVIGSFIKDSNVLIYCVDITNDLDVNLLNQDIAHYLSISPKASLVLVGTKNDASQLISTDKLHQLQTEIPLQQNLRFLTSSKEGTGLSELSNCIMSLAEREYQLKFKHHQWDDAIRNMQQSLAGLNKKKSQLIQDEYSLMIETLQDNPADHGVNAIETFVEKSKAILKGKHSNVMNAVLRIAAVAIVTILSGIAGFGLGFAAGLWIGPGALFTGILGASAGATLGSSISTGIVSHRWFKESNRNLALTQFATEAKQAKQPVDEVSFQP